MDERLNNLRIPNIIAPGVESPGRQGPRTFASAAEVSAQAAPAQDFAPLDPRGQGADGQPFRSRFSGWIRAVSLVIILVFVPEQASWAFN